MAKSDLPHGCMDLNLAQRIGTRPGNFRHEWWERALRILIRWAQEPCYEKEYQRRLRHCRKVLDAVHKYDRMAKWRNNRWKPTPTRGQ
jgi:hypothetical protein